MLTLWNEAAEKTRSPGHDGKRWSRHETWPSDPGTSEHPGADKLLAVRIRDAGSQEKFLERFKVALLGAQSHEKWISGDEAFKPKLVRLLGDAWWSELIDDGADVARDQADLARRQDKLNRETIVRMRGNLVPIEELHRLYGKPLCDEVLASIEKPAAPEAQNGHAP